MKNENNPSHKAGFVNLIGRPNVGKSTLMNALMGEKLSIVTPKAQTTRHRIIGLMNGENYQIVFSDTPGLVLSPKYAMHRAMRSMVHQAMEDADLILLLTDIYETPEGTAELLEELKKISVPKFLVINKVDLAETQKLNGLIQSWEKSKAFDTVIPVSALRALNVDKLLNIVMEHLPEHPAYFPKDEITNRNVRYFVAEIIREKIFLHYRQEVPYACEVIVTDYEESEEIDRMRAEIWVERDSQKNILIGKAGAGLKQIGIEARADIEKMIDKKVYLELFVKVKSGWRDNERLLKGLGYE